MMGAVSTGDAALCPTCGQAYPPNRTHCGNDGTALVLRRAQAQGLTGRVIADKYVVGPLLGEGVLGAVYAAKQYAIDRDVAIKVIKPSLVADPAASERLYHAASAACSLAGPAVAVGLDVNRTDDGLVYVVQELVRGRPLVRELATVRLASFQSVALAIGVCDALIVAHDAGRAHGDLKPGNVFVLDDDRGAKVADFFLARALHPDVWGQPPEVARYAAPELADRPQPEAASDLYSLGCVMYEMLAARPAFDDTSTRTLLDKVRRDAPARLPRDVPPALAAIVTRLLAKRPDERFASAREVRAALLPMSPTASAPASAPFTYADPAYVPGMRGSDPSGSGRTGVTPPTGSTPASGVYHPKTGAYVPGSGDGKSGVYHPRTAGHTQPSVLRGNTGPTPAPFASPIAPSAPDAIAPAPAPSEAPAPSGGGKRVLVIAAVAIVLSGGGVLAYLAATGGL